ncbi:PP2C family protein-serine/threonine phosphatase [Curtobacterium sp. MCPF17_002]|uniref:PP2C family protein-serine/threonine phosphatase n=1 Tax=Curtobacterium sp. MCPF17_002 TaxID=2175645 RepID=UPI000DA967CF|nr:PP2C family protein-serine/threonine phosphatase [Curtobacterium sp. MCPF17_002]WIB79034.1 PP2C family protein-serine/threonine phosphatase [Curtobacterium sp. MCPF17_002]
MTSAAGQTTRTASWTVSVRDDTGPIVLARLRTSWAPLAKQSVVAALVVAAALCSTLLPWLVVSDPVAMWTGVGLAVAGLLVAAVMARWPAVARAELLVPAVDFLAVGLLRFGTGDERSVFLAIVVLPVIWIAAWPGRRHIVYPLIGTCATLLLPYVLAPTEPRPTELIRLAFAVTVYAATAAVTNELARQAGLRLDDAQRRRRVAEGEIDRAVLVQQSLLPTTTAGLPDELRALGVCIPARAVGGDFYDWFPTPGGAAFTLGDVMGKGVGAGMIAAAVRSVIRSTVDEPDPAVAIRRAAAGLATGSSDLTSGQFTTCFHVRVDADGHARWVDAGHGLTLLRTADGSVRSLRSGHLPIGVGSSWTSETTDLAPGDVIVSVSDGVLDLFGGDLDSLDRFEAWVAARTDPHQLVDGIAELAGRGEHPDDVTVLCIAYRP